MKKPALVILAAGMGSRYGGLKQMDPMDPMGHAIIDYSIYDAKEAGFNKVVFIIRKDIFDAAGIKKPDISILSDEFLEEVRGMERKKLALELLKKILTFIYLM